MKAVVKSIYSPDLDLESEIAPNPDNFSALFQLIVGPEQSEAEESFDVQVCTALWVRDYVRENGPLLGRHHLIVDEFDIDAITAFLARAVESIEEEDWDALAEKLARIGQWEFEDYQE